MRKSLLKSFALAFMLVAPQLANAHDFEVGGIYYNITSTTNLAVKVTDAFSDEYTGSVNIPVSVSYGGSTYAVTSIGQSTFYGYLCR